MRALPVAVHSYIGAPTQAASPPPWAGRVARWEQLDPASSALVYAWHAWGAASGGVGALLPDVFLLASRSASNAADLRFARAGAVSPAKFVATLPSVSLSALLQATGWAGPMFCLQAGPRTLLAGFAEAALLCRSRPAARIGIVNFGYGDPGPAAAGVVVVRYFMIGAGAGAAAAIRLSLKEHRASDGGTGGGDDAGLLCWLDEAPSSASPADYPVGRDLALARCL